MEFDSNIARVQGLMITLDKKGLISKESISYLVEGLKEQLNSLSEDDTNSRRKITFYLFLNTESEHVELLKEDPNVGRFVHNFSRIPLELFADTVFELDLHPYLWEIFSFCPVPLTLGLLQYVITKFETPAFHQLKKRDIFHCEATKAVFFNLLGDAKNLGTQAQFDSWVSCFKSLLQLTEAVIITSCLLEQQENLKVVEFTCQHFHIFLNIVHDCVCEETVSELQELYEISMFSQTVTQADVYKVKISSIQSLLTVTENILKNLTCTLWMSFSEITSPFEEKSYQRVIGETIYYLSDKLMQKDIPHSEELQQCFKVFLIIPLLEEYEFETATIKTIVYNVLNPKKSRAKWFELLIRNEETYKNVTFIETLKRTMDLATTSDHTLIFNECVKTLSNDCDEALKSLTIDIFSGLTLQEKAVCFEVFIAKFGTGLNLETAEFSSKLVETFNKITEVSDFDWFYSEVLNLALQSSKPVIENVVKAYVINPTLTKPVYTILKFIKPVCLVTVDENNSTTLIMKIVHDFLVTNVWQKTSLQIFTQFISLLVTNDFIDLKVFLRNVVYVDIDSCLVDESVKRLCMNLSVVGELAKHINCFDSVALLLYMSNILDNTSWDSNSYTPGKMETRVLVLAIVKVLMKNVLNADDLFLPERALVVKKARRILSSTSDLHRALFCELWFDYDKTVDGTDNLVIQMLMLINNWNKIIFIEKYMEKDLKRLEAYELEKVLSYAIFMLMPLVTYNEWERLYFALSVLLKKIDPDKYGTPLATVRRVFENAMFYITLQYNMELVNKACYHYCATNLGRILSNKDKTTPGMRLIDFTNIVLFLKTIEDPADKEEISTILSPLLVKLSQQPSDTLVCNNTNPANCFSQRQMTRHVCRHSFTDHYFALVQMLDVRSVSQAVLQAQEQIIPDTYLL